MRVLILFAIIFFSHIAIYSQPATESAVINDKDGYSLVRESPDIKSNVIDTLFENEVFIIDEWQKDSSKKWLFVNYHKNNVEQQGYLHHSRAKLLFSYEKLNATINNKRISFISKDTSIVIDIIIDNFSKQHYKIEYENPNAEYPLITKINGKAYYGCDGAMPKVCYKNFDIIWNNKHFSTPKEAFDDLFSPNLNFTFATFDSKTNRLFIFADNSDGAGSYHIVWIFQNGKYLKRYIFNVC